MGRNLLRSDYKAGKPAWIDWLSVSLLVLIGVGTLLTGNGKLVALLALLAGTGFGIFVIVAEAGKLHPSESD
jgi:hypothetical protein